MNTPTLKPFLLIAVTALMAGCATTDNGAMRTELDQVRAIAEKAAADAAAANRAAAAAQARADAAMDTASRAQAQSVETDAKIDRMFKKAMYK